MSVAHSRSNVRGVNSVQQAKKSKRRTFCDRFEVKTLAHYKQAWSEFVNLYGGVRDGRIVSYVHEPVQRSLHIRRLASSVVNTRLRALPIKPEDGKWARLGPALLWTRLMNVDGVVMQRLYPLQ